MNIDKGSWTATPTSVYCAPMLVTNDMLGMIAGVLCCLLFCFWFGHGRILWEDEMLGWMLLHDPSWHHFLAAWNQGADGGGFAFYFLGRAWFHIFGASNLSFRLISATCFAGSFCVAWQASRRYYAITPTAIALFTTWFLCPPMVMHMVEGRFYGLLVLATALATSIALRLCETPTPKHWMYAGAFLANCLITTTHILGVVYSGFLLVAVVVHDVVGRQFRPLIYVAVACSWLLLLPERQAILASSAVGKPWFWTYPPDLIRFVGAFCGFSNAIAFVLLGLVGVLFYTAYRSLGLVAIVRKGYADRRLVYWIPGSLFCVPLLLGTQAHIHGTSLFINRYLLPVNIGLAFALAEVVVLIRWDSIAPTRRWFPLTGRNLRDVICAYGAVLLLWNVIHVQPFTLGAIDYTGRMTALLPKGISIVFQDAWGFTEMIGTQHDSGVQYTYLLDWPHSTNPAAPRLEVTQYHLMENWKRVGYFSGSIYFRDTFLHSHSRFLLLKRVVDAKDRNGIIIGNPMVEEFAHTPGAQVTRLRRDVFGYSVWLVCIQHRP